MLKIDFLTKAWRYRIRNASLHKEFIAKAMGISPTLNPRIIDVTAGLGRDSFILASLGYHVILIERSFAVFEALKNALHIAAQDQQFQETVARMQLIHADAVDYLSGKTAEIIYLDPMFPTKIKTAAPKKEIVQLQTLLGEDLDAMTLLEQALSCATKRVVVKRPRHSDPLGQRSPSFSYEGNSSRFDIYLIHPK